MIQQEGPLRPIKKGQIWQLRSQGTLAVVTHQSPDDPKHFSIWYISPDDSYPVQQLRDNQGNGDVPRYNKAKNCYVTARDYSSNDLVNCIYDPTPT